MTFFMSGQNNPCWISVCFISPGCVAPQWGRTTRLRLSALLTAIVNEQLHGNADFYGGPVAKKDYHEYYM
jgi:hypothetical protein